jgi:1-acyl-sn-glycerol-3-phosphate acyltransferase
VWARRAVTLPSLVLITVLWIVLLPLTLAAAAAVDVVRGGPWPVVRCVAYLALYLVSETVGLAAAFAVWLASGVWSGASPEAFVRWNRALQTLWAMALYRGAERLFALHTVVEGDDAIAPGPIILLIRHVSQADTLLPVVYVTGRHGIALRFVLKRELLWDPCLDVVGHRLPNVFVQRGSGESGREVAAIQGLMQGLGPREGVLIYPEGTRFTPSKREWALTKLATNADPERVARVRRLRRVLPPHAAGPLGLLECSQNADVVVCAHTGFEAAGSPSDLLGGALVGATVRVKFWRVPYASIPIDAAARVVWLDELWQCIDDWIGEVHPLSG